MRRLVRTPAETMAMTERTALASLPARSVPRETGLASDRASVLDSFSPETASKVKSRAMKLTIRAVMKVQLSSSNLLRKGLALPLLF